MSALNYEEAQAQGESGRPLLPVSVGLSLFRPATNGLERKHSTFRLHPLHLAFVSPYTSLAREQCYDTMSADTDPRALLKDLEKLSEAGRDRFLKLLPREDVIETFKAALRERDEAQKLGELTGNYHRHHCTKHS